MDIDIVDLLPRIFITDEYGVLQNEAPAIAVKLVRNIALDMSERLRIRTDEVRVLEEG